MKQSDIYFLISSLWLMTSLITPIFFRSILCLILALMNTFFMLRAFKHEARLRRLKHSVDKAERDLDHDKYLHLIKAIRDLKVKPKRKK